MGSERAFHLLLHLLPSARSILSATEDTIIGHCRARAFTPLLSRVTLNTLESS